MIRFWNEGRLLRSVALKEILPDLNRLRRTVSHWHWGNYVGFDRSGLFVVETVDGKRHRFDVSTGVLSLVSVFLKKAMRKHLDRLVEIEAGSKSLTPCSSSPPAMGESL
jgi:hypothetical protein